jgi:DNA-binding transcriptional ArsR family regulator
MLRALADESRRTMLETLTSGPATAGELAALLPIARPGVSRHLRVLREAGLVEVRQEAQRRVYSLRPEPLAEVERALPCLSRPADRRRPVTLIGWSSPASGRSMMGIRDCAGRGPDITAEAR